MAHKQEVSLADIMKKLEASNAENVKRFEEIKTSGAETMRRLEASTSEIQKLYAYNAESKVEIMERMETLEGKVKESLKQQAVVMNENFEEQRKRLQQNFKSMADTLDQKLEKITHRQDTKIQVISELVQSNVRKTMKIEEEAKSLAAADDTIKKSIQHHDNRVDQLEVKLKGEVDRLTREVRRLPTQALVYSTVPREERPINYFRGSRGENPIEFRIKCEKEMDSIGSILSDKDKIDFVSRYLKDAAASWFTMVNDDLKTYEEFKLAFERRYWNEYIQMRIRNTLEFGKYNPGKLSEDEYVIMLVERSKHLRPALTQKELVIKLANHFSRNIQLAIHVQGIATIEDLLILLTQMEGVIRERDPPRGVQRDNRNQNQDRGTWYSQRYRQEDKGREDRRTDDEKYPKNKNVSYDRRHEDGRTYEKQEQNNERGNYKGGYRWPNSSKRFSKPWTSDRNANTQAITVEKKQKETPRNTDERNKPSTSKTENQ